MFSYYNLIINRFESFASRRPPQTLTEAMVVDTEDAVMANFEFLGGSGGGVTRPDLEDDDQEEDMEEDLYDHETTTIESKQKNTMSANRIYNKKKVTNDFYYLVIVVTLLTLNSLDIC